MTFGHMPCLQNGFMVEFKRGKCETEKKRLRFSVIITGADVEQKRKDYAFQRS